MLGISQPIRSEPIDTYQSEEAPVPPTLLVPHPIVYAVTMLASVLCRVSTRRKVVLARGTKRVCRHAALKRLCVAEGRRWQKTGVAAIKTETDEPLVSVSHCLLASSLEPSNGA
jgi:hypothetical protein